ncbi:hypothetical protein [Streptococcus oralis]|uniref:hypothetical protein n=1 Tax=Streptococcus oralis TaxID=1303 RepID=UPI003569D05E
MRIKQVNPSVLLKNGEKKIETLSGYEFTKIKAKVSYRSVQTFFDFTKEEVSKFVELSKQVEKTNDLDKSIKKIWEDVSDSNEVDLERQILYLHSLQKKNEKDTNIEIQLLKNANKSLASRVASLEKRFEEFEKQRQTHFFKFLK